jgi:hypothetical protein
MAWSLPTPSQRTPRHAPGRSVTVAAPNYSAWQSLKHDNLQDYGRFRTIPKLPEGRTASPHWQTAAELLMLVVEHGRDPTMARILETLSNLFFHLLLLFHLSLP